MDLLTQGLVGAATAQFAAKKQEARLAAIAGFFAALLPDADAFIQSKDDPLLVLEFHRHFTHSLIFTPIAALVASLLMWPFLYKTLPFHRLLLFSFLGVLLAGFLDACTSYGTHLFWPFSDERVAWSVIAIIDPVFTLTLAIFLLIAFIKYRPALARAGLVLAGVYLILGVIQHQRAYEQAQDLIAQRGHQHEQLLVKPTIGNLLLWRSVYLADNRIYADAIRPGIFSRSKVYPGDSLPLLDPDTFNTVAPHTRAISDLRRFAEISGGWLVEHPARPGYIGDVRYAMLPTGTMPLWGVLIDPRQPELPLPFVTERTFTPQMRRDFIDMLLGRDLS